MDRLQNALRHASNKQTQRYMMSTAEADRRKARGQLDTLQGRVVVPRAGRLPGSRVG